MRTGLSFPCAGEALWATLDAADGKVGLLIVTGGSQTRIGPHRMMATLGSEIADEGFPVFRFDRRGVGDSSGSDPGFRGSAPDIQSAVAAFRAACPRLETIWGLGLCDGASALAIHGGRAALDGLILLNPWVIEAEANSPPPEAIRAHYREQLTALAGWKKLLTKGFNPVFVIKGLAALLRNSDQSLARDVTTSLAAFSGQKHILITERDATARAFMSVYDSDLGAPLRSAPEVTLARRNSASHSFAGADDHRWLTAQILAILRAV